MTDMADACKDCRMNMVPWTDPSGICKSCKETARQLASRRERRRPWWERCRR